MGSIGLPPYAEDSVQYSRSRDVLLDAIEDVLNDLGWSYGYTGKAELCVSFAITFGSWGERMTIAVHKDGTIDVRSASVFPLQWIDWGKNQQNIEQFLQRLENVLNPRRRRRDRDIEEKDDEPRPRSKRRRLSDE